jgi:hypothetical protein
MRASALSPSLPLFEAPTGDTHESEGHDGSFFETITARWPEPGNGVQMPDESDDESIMVDGDKRAFSHAYYGMAGVDFLAGPRAV